MALARARQAARRVKDRWKSKQWYTITAPAAFNNHLLGETFADEPQKLIGRTSEVTLQDLTGDMRQMHVKLNFKVSEVQDMQAKTVFTGHNMTSDYVRRLTRRGHTKIPAVFDVKTKDGSRLRVKPFAITDRRAQTGAAQDIRRIMVTHIEKAAKENTVSGFLKLVLMGELSNTIYKDARKVHPLRRVEIAKTEVLSAPSIEVDETPIIDLDAEVTDEQGEESEGIESDESEESEDSDDDAVELEGDSEDEEAEAPKADAASEEE